MMGKADLVIDYFPHQSQCYAFGGFELQMHDTGDAVGRRGLTVRKRDPWDNSTPGLIAHHWGVGYLHYDNMVWAKRSGQFVIATVLLSYFSSTMARFRAAGSRFVGRARIDRACLRLCDMVVVVNERQAHAARRFYGVPTRKVCIIPHVVRDEFFSDECGHENNGWILAGNVCRRKNQLAAARAAVEANVKLSIIGNPIPGEEGYAEELARFAADHPRVITLRPALKHTDADYLKILRSAIGLLLPSEVEQQPVIALEMGALRKHVILGDRDYAANEPFETAIKVDPGNVAAIAQALTDVEGRRASGVIAQDLRRHSFDSVGKAYEHVYCELTQRRPSR